MLMAPGADDLPSRFAYKTQTLVKSASFGDPLSPLGAPWLLDWTSTSGASTPWALTRAWPCGCAPTTKTYELGLHLCASR
jgi:hypothetical protein